MYNLIVFNSQGKEFQQSIDNYQQAINTFNNAADKYLESDLYKGIECIASYSVLIGRVINTH